MFRNGIASAKITTNCQRLLPAQNSRKLLFHNRSFLLIERLRYLSASSIRYSTSDRSRIEETLKMLKHDLLKLEQSEKDASQKKELMVEQVKPSIPKRILNELKHYYHGFRLLALDISVSLRYLRRLAGGHSLMRRERQQLIRTVSDLFRLVPFSVFLIVPFMEFALPLYIKFFPNMMPSTFQDASKQEEKLRKRLKVKLEMAKFLQETMSEIGLVRSSQAAGQQSSSKALEFAEFMEKVRSQGAFVSNAELFKYTKLFKDELTLDNLSLSSLRALCRMLDIQTLGSPEILRFQLNLKLRELKADDKEIAFEGGVDSLSIDDLQVACRARGMRALGLSEFRLKSQLKQWLELSLDSNVPPSLLLLSRALYVAEDVSFADRLKAILSSLPDSIGEQTRQKLTELEGDKVSHKSRLDLIKEIELGLQKERESMEEAKQVAAISAENLPAAAVEELSEDASVKLSDIMEKRAKSRDVNVEDLEPLENIIHGDVVLEAKHDIDELKEKISDHNQDLIELDSLVNYLKESKEAKILVKRVNRLVANVDSLMIKLEAEHRAISETVHDTSDASMSQKNGFTDALRVDDVLKSLQRFQNLTDGKRKIFEKIALALDDDTDGIIDTRIVLRVIDMLSEHKDIKISTEKIKEIVEILKREDKIEALENFFEGSSPLPPSSVGSDDGPDEAKRRSSVRSTEASEQTEKLPLDDVVDVPKNSSLPVLGSDESVLNEKNQHVR